MDNDNIKKDNQNQNQQIINVNHWFTSDLHLGHSNITKYCPDRYIFLNEQERDSIIKANKIEDPDKKREELRKISISQESMDKHNNSIIDNINSLVRKGDVLWILGDFCWGNWKNGMDKATKEYRDKIMVDDVRLVRGNHDPEEVLSIFTKTYDIVYVKLAGQGIMMCHYPMVSWKNREHYSWHIYGHCHSRNETWRETHMSNALACDVGVDCWDFKPVSFDQLKQKMELIKKNLSYI